MKKQEKAIQYAYQMQSRNFSLSELLGGGVSRFAFLSKENCFLFND